ncbi:hypothetical protein EV426DRAFT_376156 [Tirmania nivea]|nr:hypothetical protein EV426DRAFT_376156 [Tirmania nivea]
MVENHQKPFLRGIFSNRRKGSKSREPEPAPSTSSQSSSRRFFSRKPASIPDSASASPDPSTPATASTSTPTPHPTVHTNDIPAVAVCTDPNGLWQRALDIAQKKLSDKDLPPLDVSKHLSAASGANGDQSASHIVALTIGDLQATIKTKQQRADGKTTRCEEMLKMFSKYAVIVDIAIQHSPQITALVWAGVRLTLQIALNRMEIVENLEKATAMIIEKMAICDFYASIYMGTSSPKITLSVTSTERLRHTLDSALPELYASILVFSVKAQVYFSPSTNVIGIGKKAANMLKPFVHEFQPFLDDMLEKERILRECADISTMNMIMENSGTLKEIQGLLKDIESNLAPLTKLNEMVADNLNLTNDISRKMDDDKVQKLLQLLSPLEPQKRHQDVRASRLEGTGTWLLKHQRFLQWAEDTSTTQEPSDRILCCSGIPGAGKTVISSIVFDNLVSRFPQRDKAAIVCLYCDYRDKSQQTLDNLLGSLVRQCLTSMPHVPDEVAEMLGLIQRERKRIEVKDALQALKFILLQLDHAFLCIDALDELEPRIRKDLLEILRVELTNTVKLKLFLTGRPHIPLEVNQWLQVQQDPINIQASPDDIRKYLINEIACDPRPDAMNDTLQHEIVNEITHKSEGMFLLPTLQIRFVLEQTTKAKRQKSLQILPKTLGDAFACTIKRIKNSPPSVAELGMKVLTWLHLAYRPLKEEELKHALAVELGDSELDPDNIPSRKTFLDACLGLVTVDEETLTIRFVHYTLEEHFRKNSNAYFPSDHIAGVAETCLTYLSFGKLGHHCTTLEELGQYMGEFALLDYAACHWGDYVRRQCTDSVRTLVLEFIQRKSEGCHCALQVLSWSNTDVWRSGGVARLFSWVHTIAWFGLHELKRELSPRQDWSVECDNGRTPLSYAAENGHKDVVRLLVEREDVDADSKNKSGRTPLSYAAENGHKDAVVRLLVEREDVDADSKDSEGLTPLSIAAGGGNEAVVRLLVEREDVDADSRDNNGKTALDWAREIRSRRILGLVLPLSWGRYDSTVALLDQICKAKAHEEIM